MDQQVRIDKSIARGLFRQELRDSRGLFLNLADDEEDLVEDLETYFVRHCLRRAFGKGVFKPETYGAIARDVAAYRTVSTERVYGVRFSHVPGSRHRSWFETSYRRRPFGGDGDQIHSFVSHAFLKKDRVVLSRRPAVLSLTEHAVQRYLQRGSQVSLSEPNVALMVAEAWDRNGLFIFLAKAAGAVPGTRFAVPFREGLLLCEVMPSDPLGSFIDYCIPTRGMDGLVEGETGVKATMHPMLWDTDGNRMWIMAKTYVGRREMKHGQEALHDLVNGIYGRVKPEIDALSDLEGVFHPAQDPALMASLEAASPKLETALRDFVAALSFDRRLSYAFVREQEFDRDAASSIASDVETGKVIAARHFAMARSLGLEGRGGGIFCHRASVGLWDPPKGKGLPYGLLSEIERSESEGMSLAAYGF